jgi:hypothetical protein
MKKIAHIAPDFYAENTLNLVKFTVRPSLLTPAPLLFVIGPPQKKILAPPLVAQNII